MGERWERKRGKGKGEGTGKDCATYADGIVRFDRQRTASFYHTPTPVPLPQAGHAHLMAQRYNPSVSTYVRTV